jgi:hypothetical protein
VRLPFGVQEFFDVFERYNEHVWPAQLILVALALAALWLAARPRRGSDRAIALILGVLWLWMGAAYHLAFFRAINPLATVFGAAFLAQGLLFAATARRDRVRFRAYRLSGLIGGALAAFALVIYPLIGMAAGHAHPRIPTFGLPCPTTIFTLGLLLMIEPPMPRAIAVIPLGWSVVGLSAAFQLGVWQDLGLGVAAVVFLTVRILQSRLHATSRRPA